MVGSHQNQPVNDGVFPGKVLESCRSERLFQTATAIFMDA